MESKVRTVLRGLGACAALGLFLLGVPILLVLLVGNPLPGSIPAWSEVVGAVEDGVIPSGALRSVLAVVTWIWWSQIALSFAAEVWAACRGRTARSLPLRALGMQPIIVRLVALVVAVGSVGALAQPVLAATPSFAEIAVPLEVGTGAGEPYGEGSPEAPAGGARRPVAMAGQPAAPILGLPEIAVGQVPPATPVPFLGLPDESDPGWLRPRPTSPAQSAISARWDPVVVHPAPAVSSGRGRVPVAELDESDHVHSATAAAFGLDPVPVAELDEPDHVHSATAASSGWGRVPVAELNESGGRELQSSEVAGRDRVSAAKVAEPGWVVVQPGDSLWLLAERHLGDPLRWGDIFELNVGPLATGGTLRDPNLIHPGWRLRLPSPDQPGVADQPGANPVRSGRSQ